MSTLYFSRTESTAILNYRSRFFATPPRASETTQSASVLKINRGERSIFTLVFTYSVYVRPVFNQNRNMVTNMLKIPNVKFRENPNGGFHHDTGRQTDRQTDRLIFMKQQVSFHQRRLLKTLGL